MMSIEKRSQKQPQSAKRANHPSVLLQQCSKSVPYATNSKCRLMVLHWSAGQGRQQQTPNIPQQGQEDNTAKAERQRARAYTEAPAIAGNNRRRAKVLAHPHSSYEQTSKTQGLKCRPRHTAQKPRTEQHYKPAYTCPWILKLEIGSHHRKRLEVGRSDKNTP